VPVRRPATVLRRVCNGAYTVCGGRPPPSAQRCVYGSDRQNLLHVPIVAERRVWLNDEQNRPNGASLLSSTHARSVSTDVSQSTSGAPCQTTDMSFTTVPSLYVLNAAALAKPRATEHLAADLKSCNVAVAVITETHFKSKHADTIMVTRCTAETELVAEEAE